MNFLRIAIDVDGVILNIMAPFLEIFNQKYNANYIMEDLIKWDFFLDWEVSETEILSIFKKIVNNEVSVPLIEDGVPQVMKILNKQHHLDLLTAREEQNRTYLIEMLKHHAIHEDIHYNKLLMVGSKKNDIKLEHDYEVFVDDNPYLIKAIKKKSYKHLLLFDQPWNRERIEAKNIIRVHSWKEVLEEIVLFSKEI